MKFIDIAKIYLKAGDGGPGLISFRREKYVPKGGPDGGSGGKGGDIIIEANPQMNTLLDFKYKLHYIAKNGNPGGDSNKTGRSALPLYIKVPCGTLIKDSVDDEILCDLKEPYQQFIIAYGGKGGRGNSEFTTPTNQAPRYSEPGLKGEEREIILELKLLADIGIVGLPNVGKSTLISVISAAKPKIADYPFTTLIPNLGIVRISDEKSFTVADIPGLIEGASLGKGLGMQFLRHVDRTKALVFLIDAFSENHKLDFKILVNELKKYNPEMLDKNRIICISRTDAIDEDLKKKLSKISFGKNENKPLLISSVSGFGIKELIQTMWNNINEV